MFHSKQLDLLKLQVQESPALPFPVPSSGYTEYPAAYCVRGFQMSLSKVRFSLFCIAFEEITAHVQAGICPSAQSKASCALVLVVPYWGRK